MSIVAVDTNILIWGVQGKARVGQEHRIEEAGELLNVLGKQKASLALTMTTVGEYLAGLPEARHAEAMVVLQKRFRLLVYNPRCAMEAARIWRLKKHGANRELEKHRIDFPEVTSTKIKADVQIVATCVAHGVNVLYSADEPLLKMCEGYLVAIPMLSAQGVQPRLALTEAPPDNSQ